MTINEGIAKYGRLPADGEPRIHVAQEIFDTLLKAGVDCKLSSVAVAYMKWLKTQTMTEVAKPDPVKPASIAKRARRAAKRQEQQINEAMHTRLQSRIDDADRLRTLVDAREMMLIAFDGLIAQLSLRLAK